MRRLSIVLAALALAAAPAAAQQPTFTDSLLDRFAGTWVLHGTIARQETTHDITAEWVLAHQYLHVHEVSRETDAAGHPRYQADVYIGWNAQSRQYGCVWLDDYGGLSNESIGRATRTGDAIPFVFRTRTGASRSTPPSPTTAQPTRGIGRWTTSAQAPPFRSRA